MTAPALTSDSNGIESQSWAAQCVISLANTASHETLDDDVSLWSGAAEHLVKGRPYTTIEAVDDVPWVGLYAFHQLSKYAVANGYCPKIAEPTRTARRCTVGSRGRSPQG